MLRIQRLITYMRPIFQSRRFLFFLKITSSIFVFAALWRLAFLWTFFPRQPLPSDMGFAFFLGLKFDMRLAMLSFLPVLPFFIFPFLNIVRLKFLRLLSHVYFFAIFVALLIFYALDLGHYAYLGRRVDVTVLNFLSNPDISGEMLLQSYPVVWIGLGLILVIVAVHYWLKLIYKGLLKPVKNYKWHQKTLGFILGGLILLFGGWQSLNQYPLRWSEAFFSNHHFVNALALNPVLYFGDTYAFLDKEYDVAQVENYYPIISEYFNIQDKQSSPPNFLRQVPAISQVKQAPNIVLVLLETVPVSRFSAVGNPLSSAPNLDQLSREGVFFDDFYVNIYGTARSVFTVLAGVPDMSRADTSSRNPLITKQNTIVSAFKNHEKYYFIGGSANWANIRGFIRHNIPDIQMFEEPQFKADRVDVWGISDYDLFMETHEKLKNRKDKRPFFAFIQTAGNHSPYTIPKHIKGFKVDNTVSKEALERAGFRSLEQYNAMRLLDYAIGAFMEKAKTAGYADNTIFCFFGDHGTGSYQLDHMPYTEHALDLTGFHVPLIIYAPNYMKHKGVIKGMASLPDVMPTLAGLAGVSYDNKTFGKDVLKQSEAERKKNQVICVGFSEVKAKILLLSDKHVLSMYRDKSQVKLFARDAEDINDIKEAFPKQSEVYKNMAKGMYETAKYMLHHP
eukprot:COSAG01_NODE_1_length_100484_cov_170.446142_24_plen_676_part_00